MSMRATPNFLGSLTSLTAAKFIFGIWLRAA
jgi:hypothetical protein